MKQIETLHLNLDADDMLKIQNELLASLTPEMHLAAIADRLGKTGKMLAVFETSQEPSDSDYIIIGNHHVWKNTALIIYNGGE